MKSVTVINIAIALKVGQWRSSAPGGADMLRDKPINIHFEFCKRLQHSLSAPGQSRRIPARIRESSHGVPSQSFDDYLDLPL